jgi:hypothetical protein
VIRLLLALFLAATTCAAQTYTHRGFLETRGYVYPQTAPNDRARGVGEALFRYEGFYKPAATLQIAGAADFRIDTHHQVSRDFELSWWDRGTQRPLAQVRRLSATYYRGPVTFEAGKQFVRWGKTDIVTPTDRFAPRDFLNVVDNDFLAVTAARLTVERASNTVEAVWSPRMTPSRIPLPNQRWAVPPELPAGVTLHAAGTNFPGAPHFGARWNHAGEVEFEFSFYRGFNHLPSFDTTSIFTPAGLEVDIRRFHPQLTMAGAAAVISTSLFTIKGEAAHFSSNDERADEYALYVLQLERQSGEWFFVGGYAGEWLTDDGTRAATFAPDRGLTRTFLGRAGYTIDVNRSIAFEAAVRENADGLWIKSEYSQAFGQHWRLTATATLIRGEPTDFLGQYRRNFHAILLIRYSF